MREVRIDDIDESSIDTILAEDIDFTGTLTFEKPLMIKGRFEGEIRASSDLYIGDKAEVRASIKAKKVSARGRIQGDVTASSRVELFSTAIVEGDLVTPDLIIESGCRYNGVCRMNGEHLKPRQFEEVSHEE